MTPSTGSPSIRSTGGPAWAGRVGMEFHASLISAEVVVAGRTGPSTTGHSGQEALGLGALVLLLGIAFITLLVEPSQASLPGAGLLAIPPIR